MFRIRSDRWKELQDSARSKDYKRIGEGDKGLNTGGMGSVSPVPFADKAWMEKVEERIIRPTVKDWQQKASTIKALSSSA